MAGENNCGFANSHRKPERKMITEIETKTPKYLPIAQRILEATGLVISPNSISRIATSGRIDAVKIVNRWMCSEEAFLAYIAAPVRAGLPQAATTAPRTRTESARAKAQQEALDYLEKNGIS